MKHPEEPSDDFGTRWRKITKGLPAGDRSLAIAFEKALLQQIGLRENLQQWVFP